MRTIEASGKTIDEAIFNGLKELEVSIDEVEIDIVQHETKGILGITLEANSLPAPSGVHSGL